MVRSELQDTRRRQQHLSCGAITSSNTTASGPERKTTGAGLILTTPLLLVMASAPVVLRQLHSQLLGPI
jgi:hypothetical protein